VFRPPAAQAAEVDEHTDEVQKSEGGGGMPVEAGGQPAAGKQRHVRPHAPGLGLRPPGLTHVWRRPEELDLPLQRRGRKQGLRGRAPGGKVGAAHASDMVQGHAKG
jgi:hypothetical protein